MSECDSCAYTPEMTKIEEILKDLKIIDTSINVTTSKRISSQQKKPCLYCSLSNLVLLPEEIFNLF